MANETCFICGGRGKVTDYSQRYLVSSSTYGYGNKTCPECIGYGFKYKPDPPKPKPSPQPTPSFGGRERPEEKTSPQGIIGLIGFLAGTVTTYQNSDENLVAAGIVGIIVAVLAAKWYKWIIAIAVITMILYLISQSE